jgi:hypothetical protein
MARVMPARTPIALKPNAAATPVAVRTTPDGESDSIRFLDDPSATRKY